MSLHVLSVPFIVEVSRKKPLNRLGARFLAEKNFINRLTNPQIQRKSPCELVNRLAEEAQLTGYIYLPSARADFLKKLGRYHEAQREFERAAEMAGNERQRESLLAEARVCRLNGTKREKSRFL